MKKLIAITLLVLVMVIGCATMTAEEAKKAKQNFDKFPQKVLVP